MLIATLTTALIDATIAEIFCTQLEAENPRLSGGGGSKEAVSASAVQGQADLSPNAGPAEPDLESE